MPKDAPELTGKGAVSASDGAGQVGQASGSDAEGQPFDVAHDGAESGSNGNVDNGFHSAADGGSRGKADGGSPSATQVTPATLVMKRNDAANLGIAFTVPPTDGVAGGIVPPRLLDENLAVVGAMLHDIGTYLVLKHDGSDGEKLQFDGPNYILHGLRGYDWLISQGVDESIAQFARNHTGVGLTRKQVVAQGLPLPPADYVPMNLEQEVVMVADKYNSKSIPPRFLTAQAYARKARRFGEANERQWLDLVRKYGVPDIPALAKKFDMKLDE
ncbi:HD domain-containing protein [Bifidobacterium sp. ESL0775]|uniref:HD domain-containing protein n=1 Tax=Bifidobacterium sp. ESL0775 TaxID=2983230 RepID=UPI0032AF4EEF